MDRETSALSSAISCWRAGRAIPLTLFVRLTEEGYDVPSLEKFHLAKRTPHSHLAHVQDAEAIASLA